MNESVTQTFVNFAFPLGLSDWRAVVFQHDVGVEAKVISAGGNTGIDDVQAELIERYYAVGEEMRAVTTV